MYVVPRLHLLNTLRNPPSRKLLPLLNEGGSAFRGERVRRKRISAYRICHPWTQQGMDCYTIPGSAQQYSSITRNKTKKRIPAIPNPLRKSQHNTHPNTRYTIHDTKIFRNTFVFHHQISFSVAWDKREIALEKMNLKSTYR